MKFLGVKKSGGDGYLEALCAESPPNQSTRYGGLLGFRYKGKWGAVRQKVLVY